jgi:hypothetical protein
MADVTFVRQQGCDQLYLAQCDGSPPAGGAQVVYLLPEGGSAPPSFGLAAAWSGTSYADGCFFFLDEPIAAGQAGTFATNAWTYLEGPGRSGVRFAWIINPNDTEDPLQGPGLSVQPADGGYATEGVNQFTFQNIVLIIGPWCPIALNGDGFQIAPPKDTPEAIYLQAGWGATNLYVIGPAGVGFSCCSPQSGLLQFGATLQKQTDLAALDAGLRMFYQTPDSLADREAPGDDSFFVSSQRYPLLQEVAGTLSVGVSLDPIAPLDPTRTFLDLAPSGVSPTAHTSNYCTNLGHAVNLTPQSGAKLVFAPNPVASVASSADAFYLVPSGSFSVSLPSGPNSLSLMCGGSGVEYLSMASGAALQFVAGQAAYAEGFQPGQQATSPTNLDDLGGLVTTSWAFAPTSPYCAQPDDSVLHQQGSAGLQGFLQYLEVQAGTLPSSAPEQAPAFPMLPYFNTAQPFDDPASYQQLELQLIAPARRASIFTILSGAAPSGTPPPPAPWGITPQGLAAYAVSPGEWGQVVLAQDVAGDKLTLTTVRDHSNAPLYSALTTNQLLLVVSEQQTMLPFLGSSSLTLKGTSGGGANENWTFDLTPSATSGQGWDRYGTILIFKFYDKALQELVQDPSTWAHAAAFNTDPAAISAKLQQILADSSDPSLVTAYTNPSWNGILALNLPISSLPSDLGGLLAGINLAGFYCHHVGINVTPVSIVAGEPSLQTTSMFGLVNYQAPSLQNNGADYAFQVQSLRALFQNSTIVQFSSTIQLQVNALFGEPGSGPNDNILNLTGVLQTQGYSYTTQSDAPFTMNSHVLASIDLARGQFVTVAPGGNGKPSQSRFIFWGSIAFIALQSQSGPFDLFSFGGDGGGLSFANLAIDMTSTGPGEADFVFDATHMTFDLSTSQARPDSLYSHFPLSLTGFTQANSGMTPGGLGYMSVGNPLGQSSLEFPWFALNFTLNLGSLGALAAEAGFYANILAGWAPNETNYSIFVGLQLPGSTGGGQRQIVIEGILKLTFANIAFTVSTAPNGGPAYLLTLSNIALKLFLVSFPPTGQINLYLFGNPGGSGASLGWYAGYVKPSSQAPPRALPAETATRLIAAARNGANRAQP